MVTRESGACASSKKTFRSQSGSEKTRRACREGEEEKGSHCLTRCRRGVIAAGKKRKLSGQEEGRGKHGIRRTSGFSMKKEKLPRT